MTPMDLDGPGPAAAQLLVLLALLTLAMVAVVLAVFWPEPDFPPYELEVQGDDP